MNSRHFVPLVLLLFCLLLNTIPNVSFAAEKKSVSPIPGEKALKSDSPLHIASDRMEVKQNEKTILFEGHVVVQQDDLTITGRTLKVYAASTGTEKNSQSSMMDKIDRIEIEGDVKISQQDKVATADKAVYYHVEQKIVLMGNPVVSQGADKVQGRLITLYIAQGRSVVEGGAQTPVQAVLHPARKD
jgi:lipopolysaccharide export system protein LptA